MLDFSGLEKRILKYLVDKYPEKVPLYHVEDKFMEKGKEVKITMTIIKLIDKGHVKISNERVTMLTASKESTTLEL